MPSETFDVLPYGRVIPLPFMMRQLRRALLSALVTVALVAGASPYAAAPDAILPHHPLNHFPQKSPDQLAKVLAPQLVTARLWPSGRRLEPTARAAKRLPTRLSSSSPLAGSSGRAGPRCVFSPLRC